MIYSGKLDHECINHLNNDLYIWRKRDWEPEHCQILFQFSLLFIVSTIKQREKKSSYSFTFEGDVTGILQSWVQYIVKMFATS